MRSLFESQSNSTTVTRWLQVIPERSIDRYPDGLTYAEDPDGPSYSVGSRVMVPLGRGNQAVAGYVVDVKSAASSDGSLDPSRIKAVLGADRQGLSISSELIAVARWVSSYYCAPLGTVLGSVIPAAVKKGVGHKAVSLIDLPEPTICGSAETPEYANLRPSQQRIVDVLVNASVRPIEMKVLANLAGLKSTAAIKRLVDRGVLSLHKESRIQSAWQQMAIVPTEIITPTEAQKRIITAIGSSLDEGFGVHVIHGVTGSGKTEIYMHLIEKVLGKGQQAIVLVPEIALTPQTVGRFLARFGTGIAIQHSGLTAAQRNDQWAMIARGEARVIIGARSAVFAPIPQGQLGVIVVDEEHDSSYKQDQAPRYHARDVAIRRAQLSGAAVVLGSATPSLETWYNAHERRTYRWHDLPERVPGAALPKVEVVDFREEMKRIAQQDRRHVHLLGPTMLHALRRTLDDQGQAMLLLNRRGYANYIACPASSCGWVLTCEHCDVAAVFHKNRELPTGGFVQCHHCLAQTRLPDVCPACSRKISVFGMGTQRIEEELTHLFPELKVGSTLGRMDADTMNKAGDYYRILDQLRFGELRVLVGTQMIAKGLDFPNVRLVGVVNADTSIHLPDFRSAERTFQLVSQVAGRCGRGVHAGRVVVQSFQPNHPAIECASRHDYAGFVQTELPARRGAGLPPVGRLVNVVVRDLDHRKASARAGELAQALRTIADRIEQGRGALSATDKIRVRGPAPCPLSRISDHYRVGIEILAPSAALIQQILTEMRNTVGAASDAHTAIDVDPVSLL